MKGGGKEPIKVTGGMRGTRKSRLTRVTTMSLKFNSVVSRGFQKGKCDELCITHCRVEGSVPRHQEEQFF